jgi:hypothetical protein
MSFAFRFGNGSNPLTSSCLSYYGNTRAEVRDLNRKRRFVERFSALYRAVENYSFPVGFAPRRAKLPSMSKSGESMSM